MKYLLTLLLFPCLTYGQQVLTIGNGLDLTNNTLTAKLQPIQDSLKNAYAIANAANTNANSAYNAATTAQTTANGAVSVNSNQAVQITTANNNITALQQADIDIKNQIANIVIPPSAGIPAPVVTSTSYTLTAADYNKTIWLSCSSCTVYTPILPAGFKCFIQSSVGTVSIKPVGLVTYQVGSDLSVTVNQRPVMIDYRTTSNVNVR